MAFVGRARALSRLLHAVEEAASGRARLVLVAGEAGIGKTTLVSEAAARSGWAVGWGTCADAERAPAFWAWSTALRGLLDATGPVVTEDGAELARLLPELSGQTAGEAPPEPGTGAADPVAPPGPGAVPVAADPGDTEAARLRLFDAVARFLERLACRAPAFVVLDDLQWADASTLDLLRFVARPYRPVPLVIVGAYRPDELAEPENFVELTARADTVRLSGLTADEVTALVTDVAGDAAADTWAAEVHRRTDGHPFFARQLTELLVGAGPAAAVPEAVRDVVDRRVRRLSAECRALVEAAAVAGNDLMPDVLAAVAGHDAATVTRLMEEGAQARVLVRGADGTRLAHDLFRETVAAGLDVPRRLRLHQQIADALEQRLARGAAVAPADLARHTAAAAPLEGSDRAVGWARRAAQADCARLAFAEAADHLARARRAVEDSGAPDAAALLVDLLVEEADARARTGDPGQARTLLDDARGRASACGDAERLARVALGVQRLGARFAMPRDAVVEELEAALVGLSGRGTPLEAHLAASLARELHHSVPAQRPRARPLSEQALALARTLDDPTTLAACLLARHDILWTPGRAGERIAIAREISDLAARTGDAERHAEGLLLTANALLEQGSAAFRSALADFLRASDGFRQPRHDYLAMTRRGALALLDGRLDEAERLIATSSALGERIGEPDAGNVRMSQLLGLVRARRDPERLRAIAGDAVRWWVGVPSHAHAVAAGFLARTGDPDDLEAARRALDTVVALDVWRADRSYLWSVFVGEMTTAAVRLGDRAVCAQLLAELEPVTDTCGVNGALVCFMGSNAHWAGVLAAALGRPDDARRLLHQALDVHRRLGAAAWAAETAQELAALGDPASPTEAALVCEGDLWCVRHLGISVHLRDLKGLADLAVLLARSGADVHVLELADAGPHDRAGDPRLDATARAAYRRRLAELDEDRAAAAAANDLALAERLDGERAALLAELRRAAGLGGRGRGLGTSTSERARKAVTARIRDAIHRIGAVLPELGAHLDRSVLTGTTCRYAPTEPVTWTVIRAPSTGRRGRR